MQDPALLHEHAKAQAISARQRTVLYLSPRAPFHLGIRGYYSCRWLSPKQYPARRETSSRPGGSCGNRTAISKSLWNSAGIPSDCGSPKTGSTRAAGSAASTGPGTRQGCHCGLTTTCWGHPLKTRKDLHLLMHRASIHVRRLSELSTSDIWLPIRLFQS
jgi:hypothetical protein